MLSFQERRRRVSNLIMATKSAEPMIDQIIGKRVPPILTAIQLGKEAKANPQTIANMEKLVAGWKAKGR